MNSSPTALSEFELAVLKRIAEDNPALEFRLEQLVVMKREFTGAGSFTYFVREGDSCGGRGDYLGLNGHIVMPGVPLGMSAVLFCCDGFADHMEIVTCGADRWSGESEGFSIVDAV